MPTIHPSGECCKNPRGDAEHGVCKCLNPFEGKLNENIRFWGWMKNPTKKGLLSTLEL